MLNSGIDPGLRAAGKSHRAGADAALTIHRCPMGAAFASGNGAGACAVFEWLFGLLDWSAIHKDGLVAIAALVSPVVAVIGTVMAAVMSSRAVVTGPRIQREIARDQLALQKRTVVANLLGAADHAWIEDFRRTLAELQGVMSERSSIMHTQKKSGNDDFQVVRLVDLAKIGEPLIAKLRLLVGTDSAARELNVLARKWQLADNLDDSSKMEGQVFEAALRIIEQKQAGIADRITAVERGEVALQQAKSAARSLPMHAP